MADTTPSVDPNKPTAADPKANPGSTAPKEAPKTEATQATGSTTPDNPGTPNQAPKPEDAPVKDLQNTQMADTLGERAEAAATTPNEKREYVVLAGKHFYKDENGNQVNAKVGESVWLTPKQASKLVDRLQLKAK